MQLVAQWGVLRDGDDRDDDIYAGHVYVNASCKTRPGVVGADRMPITDQEWFYSGCYGYVSINFYAFNTNGNMGVAAGLNNVMKLKDGDALGGRSSAESDFADIDTNAPQQANSADPKGPRGGFIK